MYREDSFGVIPLQKHQNIWYVCLVKHKNGNFWAFPKGHPEKNESPTETAKRELKEETGLVVSNFLLDQAVTENYCFIRDGEEIDKWVHYYLAEVSGDVVIDNNECLDFKWVQLEEAESLATYKEAKKVCRTLLNLTHKLL